MFAAYEHDVALMTSGARDHDPSAPYDGAPPQMTGEEHEQRALK